MARKLAISLAAAVTVAAVFIAVVDRRPDVSAPGYEEALAALRDVIPPPHGGAQERSAIERLTAFWSDLDAAVVAAEIDSVYSTNIWFYDTVKTITNLNELSHYLVETADRVDACHVEFLDEMRAGQGVFMRWKMTIDPSIGRENDLWVSYGITHFVFDGEGRVVLHRDYWDPADGIYEKLPGIGWILRNIRARL